MDVKSESFVCSALRPFSQQDRLNRKKYTFDLSMCDHILDVLVENKFVRISDHHVLPSIQERIYCRLHNSFKHSTKDWNMFRQIIQSAIDKG